MIVVLSAEAADALSLVLDCNDDPAHLEDAGIDPVALQEARLAVLDAIRGA